MERSESGARLVTLRGAVVGTVEQNPETGRWSYEWAGGWSQGVSDLEPVEPEHAEGWAVEEVASLLAMRPPGWETEEDRRLESMARDPQPGPAIRALCTRLAEQNSLDFDREMSRQHDGDYGATPAQIAFALVRPGASLVLNLAEQDGYPAGRSRARKQGVKTVAKSFGSFGATWATVFMAHALFEHMAIVQQAHGDAALAETYRLLQAEALERWYPLNERWRDRLVECSAELEHLLQGTSPRLPSNGFHIAAARGEDPREDPELVEIERHAVGTYFRRRAAAAAIELAVGPEKWRKLPFLGPSDVSPEQLTVTAAEASVWNSVTEQWMPVIHHALTSRSHL